MMSVIVNADDLGLSQEVNDATFDLMSRRIVTSATIMANGPFVRHAIEESKRFPACSFGIHLNLTEFRPLSQGEGLEEILGEDGAFTDTLDQAPGSVRKTRRLLRAIANEWCHQVDFLQRAGVRISHLDSHQHVHTIPFLFSVLKHVQSRFGIRRVRGTRNVYRAGPRPAPAVLWAKRAFQFALRHLYATRTTHAFMDFLTFHERAVVGRQEWPTAEVMVHPGSAADAEENRLLDSDWPDRLRGRVRLISYADL
jgi:chitin disaccharide deacetylase